MQLKKKSAISPARVSCALAAATCSLLGASTAAASGGDDVRVDAAVLFYNEKNRVTATEPVLRAERHFANDSDLSMKLTLDSLTGASHNGGIISDQPQTFASPSGSSAPTSTTSASGESEGGGPYTINPGDLPLDSTFKDQRFAFNLQYTRPWVRTLRWLAGFNLSSEHDFSSLGANAGLLWDLNQKNTTLALSFSHEGDSISPVGGVPVPLSSMPSTTTAVAATDKMTQGGSESRTVDDVLFGITQVMTRRWIMQLNYDISNSSGYHTDPYKIVTLYDPGTDTIEDYLYESRPDTRSKKSIYWENRYHFNQDSVALSYRYMTDDWGIASHTFDIKYRYELGSGWYLQPHLRHYTQTAADFWHEYLTPAQNTADLQYASADYRLGRLQDRTYGLKLGHVLPHGREWGVRLESFQQSGDTPAADVNATIFQLGYTLRW